MAQVGRGMPPMKEKIWKHMTEKEDTMRLKWFHKNQQKLLKIAEQESARVGLSKEILDEVQKMREERYRNMQRFGKKKAGDAEFQDIDPHCILNVMKPVPPTTKNMLYNPMDDRGRKTYLHARVQIKPEDKFYFPETAASNYGWDVSERSKKMQMKRYGRCQVIKHSFYRRNGALKSDPEYYREPQQDSPTVCKL